MLRLIGIFAFLYTTSSFAQKVEGKVDTISNPVDSTNLKKKNKISTKVVVQIDTIREPADSLIVRKGGKIITIQSYAKRYQPRKALLYAAVVPGTGQIYNKKYWKVPLVWGGFYLLTTNAMKYNELFLKYKNELFYLLEHPTGSSTSTGSSTGSTTGTGTSSSPTSTSGFTEAQLRDIIDNYRRQRDFFIVLDGFLYILQIVDAHVDAHLKEFDLNPNLKVSIEPSVQQNRMIGRTSGFSLTLKF